jgi:hypothetical protein
LGVLSFMRVLLVLLLALACAWRTPMGRRLQHQ